MSTNDKTHSAPSAMAREQAATIFACAGIDITDLVCIPGTAVHPFMVSAVGWLDSVDNVLMFVGKNSKAVALFMYFIGEEHNRDVVGVGPGIVAYSVSEERAEYIEGKVQS